jgi:hypothetical protein
VTISSLLLTKDVNGRRANAKAEKREVSNIVLSPLGEENPGTGVGNATFWMDLFATLMEGLDPGLLVRYPRIGECDSEWENCFAVQVTTGSCVCTL